MSRFVDAERGETTPIMSHCGPEKRKIIIVGKAGSGKTTIIKKILDHSKAGAPIKENGVHEGKNKAGTNFSILEVDTVDFYGERSDTNYTITDTIKEFIALGAQREVYLIIFVFKHGRFTAIEETAFSSIINSFEGDVTQISALVVTGCEGMSTESRRSIREDIGRNPVTEIIAKQVQSRILTVGFPNMSTMRPELKEEMMSGIAQDEQDLQKFVTKGRKPQQAVAKQSLSNYFEHSYDFITKRCTIL